MRSGNFVMPSAFCSLFLSVFLLGILPVASIGVSTAFAGIDALSGFNTGGHLRLRGSVVFLDADSPMRILQRNRLYDAAIEARVKAEFTPFERVNAEIHYEIEGNGGESRQAQYTLLSDFPGTLKSFLPQGVISDDRRVMDLTQIISDHKNFILYHRIDRLAVTCAPHWGSVCIGRQAITWGNGFLFNPMDVFNPFSPTDVERDYKIGDDMASGRIFVGNGGELAILYVPRRKPESGEIDPDMSSWAAKYHFSIQTTEVDMMAAGHYNDELLGFGLAGYIGGAAWRTDWNYTIMDQGSEGPDFLQIMANLDYSWVLGGKNCYGWIEYFYSGLGHSDYGKALTDRALMDRISRGERFTLGRSYLDMSLQVEWHPLVNLYFTTIVNTQDPSSVLQPRLLWSYSQNIQIIAGGNIYCGGSNTEFGGIDAPGTEWKLAPADSVYLWFSWFF